jgi:hypothetical protein
MIDQNGQYATFNYRLSAELIPFVRLARTDEPPAMAIRAFLYVSLWKIS